ncbi:hypothetical protein QJQ45_023640 [Haematococcus lacustris]|nr:hypothetical protein QJQ45_023640 [Haematococcus lacustris]
MMHATLGAARSARLCLVICTRPTRGRIAFATRAKADHQPSEGVPVETTKPRQPASVQPYGKAPMMPFRRMNDALSMMQREFDSLLNVFDNDPFFSGSRLGRNLLSPMLRDSLPSLDARMPALASSLPQVQDYMLEWVEREQDWQLHVELPGLAKEDVQASMTPSTSSNHSTRIFELCLFVQLCLPAVHDKMFGHRYMHLDPEIHLLTLRAESSEGSNSEAGNGKAASDVEGAGPTAKTMRRRSFSASVRLPEDVDMQAVDTLQASMKDGLLTLSLPKVKQAPPKQPKQIPVM